MDGTGVNFKGYVLSATLGAIAGGLIVLLIIKAAPGLMPRMMSRMMQGMMAQMEEDGELPEMCRQMMERCISEQEKA